LPAQYTVDLTKSDKRGDLTAAQLQAIQPTAFDIGVIV
jgi:hypothetical protein